LHIPGSTFRRHSCPRLGQQALSAVPTGVHINSGILNHAFYRAAIAIGGKT
jgi:Zn-dependent metalloprotease